MIPSRRSALLLTLGLVISASACNSSTDSPPLGAPRLENVLYTSAPAPSGGLKIVCMQAPNGSDASTTCPVIAWNGVQYWAFSHTDNRSAMTVVAYDAAGAAVGQLERQGARYLWQITVDSTARTATLYGQANQTITLTWDELLDLVP